MTATIDCRLIMNLEAQAEALYLEDAQRKQWTSRRPWRSIHAALRDWYRQQVQNPNRLEHGIRPEACEHCDETHGY